jgi:glycosyltransferase involved in cell wall biosynthesis
VKILHITETFAPAGGIETYVLELLPLLEARGHQNAVIYRREHPRTPATDGKPIYHVPVTEEPERNRALIADIIRREKPTIIYLHAVYDPDVVMEAARLAPTVAYVHGFYPVCPGLAKYYRRGDQVCTRPFGLGCVPLIYLRRCASARHPRSVSRIMQTTRQHLAAYRSLPQVFVASSYMKDLLIQNGFEARRIAVLPYFIHLPPKSEITDPGPDRPSILFAGRLEIEKGLPYLLRALRLVRMPHQFFVAGDGSLKQRYILLAKHLNVASRVQFLGWLSANELQACYRRCTVAVMPTIMPEPFGKVGVEAMANSRPVVAFNVGGIPDWLKDGYNGFLVPSRDVKRLAARIDQLLDDAALATQLGSNGRTYVEQNYSSQQHLDQLLHILKTVTHSSGYNRCL